MGLKSGVPEDEFMAWLEASCNASGVPVWVTDPEVLSRVGRLLGGPPGTDRAPRRGAPSTDRTRQAS